MEGREHPLEVLERETAVARVVQKVAVIVPVDEVISHRGKENEQRNRKDQYGKPPTLPFKRTIVGGRLLRPPRSPCPASGCHRRIVSRGGGPPLSDRARYSRLSFLFTHTLATREAESRERQRAAMGPSPPRGSKPGGGRRGSPEMRPLGTDESASNSTPPPETRTKSSFRCASAANI